METISRKKIESQGTGNRERQALVRRVREVASGAAKRTKRDELIAAARRRELDAILVWKLDRWGRAVTDLVATLHELSALGVAFVSLTEALDLSTPSGRAPATMLAVFAEFERDMLRERVRGGLDAYALRGSASAALRRPPYTQPRSVLSAREGPPTRRSPAGSTSESPPCAESSRGNRSLGGPRSRVDARHYSLGSVATRGP
jgi:DNA invertase Pin-like site-specific DNA recombinase